MSRTIEIPTVGIDRQAPANEARFDRARVLLGSRNELMGSVVRDLGAHVQRVIDIFNQTPVNSLSGQHELPDGITRQLHTEFLTGSGKKIFELWFGKGTTFEDVQEDTAKQQALVAILYGSQKLKRVDATGQVIQRSRKSVIGGVENPVYQIHTHVEIPFILNELGLNDPLSVVLGTNHDTTEEGTRAVIGPDGIRHAEVVDTKALIRNFPENNLGRNLAMGIQVLTESERDEIVTANPDIFAELSQTEITTPFGNHRKVGNKENTSGIFAEMRAKTGQDNETIDEHLLESPLKYGGLALQVESFARKAARGKIPGMSKHEAIGLAKSIINVELADRIGDMAGFTRIVASKSLTPEYKRQRIIMYAARMANMLEKLQGAARKIGATDEYKSHFQLYDEIMKVQIAQVNVEFGKPEVNIPRITTEEMTDFYWNVAKPIQRRADRLMSRFVDKKIDRIIQESAIAV